MSHVAARGSVLRQTRLGPIETLDTGEGPALLALHGAVGGWDQSALLARALSGDNPGRRVIAVSRPGYLGTLIASGETPERQADLFAALLDALKIETATVAAVSAGGPSALHFAARHPARCRGLILASCCTTALETPPEALKRMRMMALLARVPGFVPFLRWRLAREPDAAARRAIPDPDLRAQTLAHSEAGALLQQLQLSVLHCLADRLPGTLNDIAQFSALAPVPFARVLAPTLVIHGKADKVAPFSHAEKAAAQLRRAELFAIEGGPHVALFTHLDAIRRRTAAFLAGA